MRDVKICQAVASRALMALSITLALDGLGPWVQKISVVQIPTSNFRGGQGRRCYEQENETKMSNGMHV